MVFPVIVKLVGTLNITPVGSLLFIVRVVIFPDGEVVEFLKRPVPLIIWVFVETPAVCDVNVPKYKVPVEVYMPELLIVKFLPT